MTPGGPVGRWAHLLPALLAPTALAQLELLQPPPTLRSLPEPPMLEHALLENPIPAVLLLVALGLGSYAVCVRLGKRRAGGLGAGVGLGLAALLVGIATLVQTERERVKAVTNELVGAVATADGVALDRLLADDARLYVQGSPAGWPRERIIEWIDKYLAPGSLYGVESHRVDQVQAEVKPSGGFARTRASVLVTPEQSPPTRCICMLSWELMDGEWIAVEIEPLWLQGWGEVSNSAMRERW